MHGESDTPENATSNDGDTLDPKAAIALLDQTSRRAQRQFEWTTPLLLLLAAALVLVCYGDIWLSVRGQDPYTGPSGTALAVLFMILFIWIVVVAVFGRRALRGIGGRSARQRQAAGITFGTIYVLVYVFVGALNVAGASPAIVYGIYPAAAPLIILGSAAAAYEAAQEQWGWSAFALALVGLAALAAYAGPVDVWGVIGIGFSLLLVTRGASQIWYWQPR